VIRALTIASVLCAMSVAGQPILFVARHQYAPDHHNTETFFQCGEINTAKYRSGSALRLFDPQTKQVRTILDAGPTGLVRDPEVSFDGKRIIFSMRRNIADDTHIYEINADSTGLRQLTFAKGVSDIDPLYLPDDSILFVSTREPKYCMCNRHIMGNIFRMDVDGANIHQIGKSTLHEGHPSLMPDGRVLYDRWEYVDRNFGDAQALWVVNPDGTQHAIFWGSNLSSPGAVIDGRAVPGTPYTLAVFCACHDRPWGAVALLDRRQGVDTRESVIRTWPAEAINLFKKGGFDSNKKLTPKYEDPYPLDAKRFLVSRQITPGDEKMGIYLVDADGNETLLYEECGAGLQPAQSANNNGQVANLPHSTFGCFDPMPLAPRPRPPVIPTRRDYRNKTGTFYVQDVYTGTHMDGVERGSVKWLRVIESPEKRSWTHPVWEGQGIQAPGMNWHNFESKRILGAVPVESDGSAYFEVPSDRFVFFQLLDERRMMVQSMRSGTIIQSGETQGCVGCHENRTAGMVPSKATLAMRRPASKLNGWHGPPRDFDFLTEVQPVLTKHCLPCHDYGKAGAKRFVLAPDRDFVFNAAYIELWAKKIITCVGGGPAEIQPPKSWGSHASRLISAARKYKLTAEEMDRLITWVDLNAPFYPSYLCAFPNNLTGRCPLDNSQVKRLSQLTGVDLTKHDGHNTLKHPWISFDRPEFSPILATVTNGFDEALAIIRDGQRKLEQAGVSAADKARDRKYEQRAAIEQRNRLAILEGRKVYDERP